MTDSNFFEARDKGGENPGNAGRGKVVHHPIQRTQRYFLFLQSTRYRAKSISSNRFRILSEYDVPFCRVASLAPTQELALVIDVPFWADSKYPGQSVCYSAAIVTVEVQGLC